MTESEPSPSHLAATSMMSITHSVITGGTYTQYQHHTHIEAQKTGWDILQKAIAPGAFHNSGERYDPPKCHPNTRVAVMQRIMNWIVRQDEETKSYTMIWLNGAAGAGKSAIAQSIAERCYEEGYLAGSFFFGRSDPNRNHSRSLVPTIAYQMALAFPEVRQTLIPTIEHDPLVFTRSLSTQFSSLIVKPMQKLVVDGSIARNPITPRLIVIDGLDECLDYKGRSEIMNTIVREAVDQQLPLMFLIASRPEQDIALRLNREDTQGVMISLPLDYSYRPDSDIERFLSDKFQDIRETHPLRKLIPTPWPSDDALRNLVLKSSGQFIYASTVMRFIGSTRHRPHHRLEVVQDIRRAGMDMPFVELDALYSHILSQVEQAELALRVIAYEMLHKSRLSHSTTETEYILGLEPGEIDILFCDLASIISLDEYDDEKTLHILHASLNDFLTDRARAGVFFIDLNLETVNIICKCVQYMAFTPFEGDKLHAAHIDAMRFFGDHAERFLDNACLQKDLYGISIPSWFKWVETNSKTISYDNCIYEVNFHWIVILLWILASSDVEGAKALHAHHLRSLHNALDNHLQLYFSDRRLTLFIALIDFVVRKPKERHNTLHPNVLLFEVDYALMRLDSKRLGLFSLLTFACLEKADKGTVYKSFPELIHQYLTTYADSNQHCLNGATFADAALCCLDYLSDSNPDPVTKVHQHCAEYTTLVHDQAITHGYKLYDGPDPWRNKYATAGKYFSYFMRKATHCTELIERCRNTTFLKLARELPEVAEVAMASVSKYLKRPLPT